VIDEVRDPIAVGRVAEEVVGEDAPAVDTGREPRDDAGRTVESTVIQRLGSDRHLPKARQHRHQNWDDAGREVVKKPLGQRRVNLDLAALRHRGEERCNQEAVGPLGRQIALVLRGDGEPKPVAPTESVDLAGENRAAILPRERRCVQLHRAIPLVRPLWPRFDNRSIASARQRPYVRR
jgi:hypothetical protein